MKNWLVLTVCFSIGGVACGDDGTGGSGASGAQGGSGATGATGGGGSASTGGGGQGGSGGHGGSGGADCTALVQSVGTALEAAKACDASNDGPNVCTQVENGLCCPELLNASNAAAVAAYIDALDAVTAAQCQVDCPAVPCIEMPTGSCIGQGMNGTCTPINL